MKTYDTCYSRPTNRMGPHNNARFRNWSGGGVARSARKSRLGVTQPTGGVIARYFRQLAQQRHAANGGGSS